MAEQYNEDILKSIILWVGDAPNFGAEYDNNESPTYQRISETFNEWQVIDTLRVAQSRVAELMPNARDIVLSHNYDWWITIIYHRPTTRDEYIDMRMRTWRQQSLNNNYKNYLFRTLWLKHQSSIRNIYIKLLLEHKISLEDFKDLVDRRDAEVNLIEVCQWEPTYIQGYFI